jgi:hypothetical protein
MSSLTLPTFGSYDHPAGQVTVPRRDVGAKVNALAGYRVDWLVLGTTVSMVRLDDSAGFETAN